jgi:hypothetical protein
VGDGVHLHRDGDRGDLESDERDPLADEEPAEIRVLERLGVDGQPTQAPAEYPVTEWNR